MKQKTFIKNIALLGVSVGIAGFGVYNVQAAATEPQEYLVDGKPVKEELFSKSVQSLPASKEIPRNWNTKAASSFTKQQALNWVKGKVGQTIDVDGYYGGQCVDLTMAYYDFLNGSHVNGNGVDYWSNPLPKGWTRIANTPTFVPEPGDIMVFSGNTYGHVAIFESGNVNTYTGYHQNFNSIQKVQQVKNLPYNVAGLNFLGVIRPNFRKEAPVSDISVQYKAHVQDIGWQSAVSDGAVAGTTGKSLRLEAININLINKTNYSGGIQYSAHIQDKAWLPPVSNGQTAGTTGKFLRLEALKISLTGNLAKYYDVEYRAHVQNIGWQGWVRNGQIAGTTGKSLRAEAVQIRLVKK